MEALTKYVRSNYPDADTVMLAECLWLLGIMVPEDKKRAPFILDEKLFDLKADVDKTLPTLPELDGSPIGSEDKKPKRPNDWADNMPPPTDDETVGNLHAPSHRVAEEQEQKGNWVRVPAATPLSNQLAIGRALLAFMRRRPSRFRSVIDENATVDLTAEQWNSEKKLLAVPVMKPEKERLYGVTIVVEVNRSFEIWKPVIGSFTKLIRGHGAFLKVKQFHLSWEARKAEVQCPHSRRVFGQDWVPSDRENLTIVVSDGVSAAWSNGEMAALLDKWSGKGSVVILQLFPENVWWRTRIGWPTTQATVRNGGGNSPEMFYRDASGHWASAGNLRQQGLVGCPVIGFEPERLRAWAKMIIFPGSPAPGVFLPLNPLQEYTGIGQKNEIQDADELPEDLVRRFRMIVSDTAFRLAVYLSAVPLSSSAMRMILNIMRPKVSIFDLAEVIMGGIVERIKKERGGGGEDAVLYEFKEGVREALLSWIFYSDYKKIREKISEYLEAHVGQSFDFGAVLANSQGSAAIPIHLAPLVQVSRRAGKALGILDEGMSMAA